MDIKFCQTQNNILLSYVKPYTNILFHIFPQYIYATMEELAKRKDLAITNADKGGAVIIMDTDSYIKEANRQLYNKFSYKQLKTQHYTIAECSTKQ